MSFNLFVACLGIFAHFFSIVPFLLLLKRGGYQSNNYRLILYFLAFTMVYELSQFYTEWNAIMDHHIINGHIVIEFLIISVIFYQFFELKWPKLIIIIFTILFLVFSWYQFLYLKDYMKINDFVYGLANLEIVLFCLLYFYQTLFLFKPISFFKEFNNWFVVGTFFYYTAIFVNSIFSRKIMWGDFNFAYKFYFVNLLFLISYRIFLSIGIWQIRTTK